MEDIVLSKMLMESCNDMKEYAVKNCYIDYVDNENSCFWYHAAWQYLRILDCVSAPQWHNKFYRDAINSALENRSKEKIKILISGTADYSMLHLLIDAFYKIDLLEKGHFQIDIHILDKCPTPIEMCRRYIELIKKFDPEKSSYMEKNIKIVSQEKDIFLFQEVDFDLICTDAFLTRFSEENVRSVLKKWMNMLARNGVVITTVREHRQIMKKTLMEATKDINKFEKKVIDKYREKDSFPISEEELRFLANRYIIKMVSNDIGNREQIEKLFKDEGFNIVIYEMEKVEGEIDNTEYCHIVARRE